MKTTILRLCAASIVLLSFTGCNSDPPITPNDSVYAQVPRITGFRITNEQAVELGTWGTLDWKQGSREDLFLYSPYPNPFSGSTLITFWNDDTVTVSIWLVRGFGPGQSEEDIYAEPYPATPVANPHKPIVIVQDRVFPPTVHSVEWDGRDNDGFIAPGGFYRIYCRTERELRWVDVYDLYPHRLVEIRDILDFQPY